MYTRGLSLLIGYLLGNFMTAEVVTRKLTGKPCKELGITGNPGMANVMAYLGFRAGITVLIGDLGKCILACLIAFLCFGNEIGQLSVLYAGFGATLGHDFPILFPNCKGGKGVAASSIALFLFSPIVGLAANIVGMLVVFATQYLCIGGVVIPAVFAAAAYFLWGWEVCLVGAALTVLSFIKHFSRIREIPSGTAERTDVLGAIRKKIRKE